VTGQVVLEGTSPNGIDAVVEQDGRVAYFYLFGEPGSNFGMRSCWIRNLVPAPDSLDAVAMRDGAAPLLPRQHCVHPAGALPLDPARLSLIWFEEGDAAALLEDDVIIAMIPCWGGRDGFDGYARDCVSENQLCWPLLPENLLHERVLGARQYWSSWNAEVSPWTAVQEGQIAACCEQIGPYEKYYNINGDAWPPRAMVRIPVADGIVLATIGMCVRAQPTVELSMEQPEDYRRIELGMALGAELLAHADTLARYLSAQAKFPWSANEWLGPQHTIPCDSFPGTGFETILLCRTFPGAPEVVLPGFWNDPVHLLWAIPITVAERDFAVNTGSAELVQLLVAAGVGGVFRMRKSVC
jgi:hypothetical protein